MYLSNTPLFSSALSFNNKAKCEIVNNIWLHLQLIPPDLVEDEYEAFFRHFWRVLHDLHPHAKRFAAQTFDDLFSLTETLRNSPHLTRHESRAQILLDHPTGPDELDRSLELAVRLWLGINVLSTKLAVGPQNARDLSGRIHWKENDTLMEMSTAPFLAGAGRSGEIGRRFDSSFTACNLSRICLITISWTHSLADHLKLEGPRGKRSLSVYQRKICLVNHRNSPQSSPIRHDVLEEAIRSLDLLFPFQDSEIQEFLKAENVQICSLSPTARSAAAFSPNDFYYWNSNISELWSIFYGPPETAWQALLDTRHWNQWITLWVAVFGVIILTILFGIFATVYAAKSYHVAMQSYEVSLKAYELSLLQACR